FCVIHVKGIVMTLEPVAIIEVEGQGIIHPHRREVPHRSLIRQTKDVRKEPCRRFLVVRWDNGMVQCDSHTIPPEPEALPYIMQPAHAAPLPLAASIDLAQWQVNPDSPIMTRLLSSAFLVSHRNSYSKC